MSKLAPDEWRELRELRAKKNKSSDEMARLVILNCKLYGMAGASE